MIIKVKCSFPIGDLMLATNNIQDEQGNWENKIVNISSLNRNIGENKAYEISGVSIELSDTDRFFRNMMSGTKRFIAGKKVTLYTENNQLIYTGVVQKWQFNEGTFVLEINDKLSGMERILTKIITKEEYANAAEIALGASIPIIYGTLYAETGAVKCLRVDTGKYILAGHHCAGIDDVFKSDGTLIPPEQYSMSNEGSESNQTAICYLLWTPPAPAQGEDPQDEKPVDFLCANVRGKINDEGTLIEDPIPAMKDIINSYSRMAYDEAELDKSDTIMANRGYKIACVVDTQKTLNNVLVEFSFSFDCDFYLSKGNEIVISLVEWSTLDLKRRFSENQIISFQVKELPEEIRNKVKYMYRYNYAAGVFQSMPVYTKQTSIDNWGEFYNSNESLDLTYTFSDDSALDVVQRFVIQRKNPRRVADVSIPLSEFAGLDIADIIEIEHSAAIDANPRKYQIRRINVNFISDVVQMEALDITPMTGGMLVLGDRDWLTAVPGGVPKLKPKWSDEDDFSRGYAYLADRSDWYFNNDIDYGKVLY